VTVNVRFRWESFPADTNEINSSGESQRKINDRIKRQNRKFKSSVSRANRTLAQAREVRISGKVTPIITSPTFRNINTSSISKLSANKARPSIRQNTVHQIDRRIDFAGRQQVRSFRGRAQQLSDQSRVTFQARILRIEESKAKGVRGTPLTRMEVFRPRGDADSREFLDNFITSPSSLKTLINLRNNPRSLRITPAPLADTARRQASENLSKEFNQR